MAVPSAQVFPFDKNLFSPKSISGNHVDTYHRWMEITIFASLFQLPSISIPVGFNKNNLPMGMQLIAPYNEDAKHYHLLCFTKTRLIIVKISQKFLIIFIMTDNIICETNKTLVTQEDNKAYGTFRSIEELVNAIFTKLIDMD